MGNLLVQQFDIQRHKPGATGTTGCVGHFLNSICNFLCPLQAKHNPVLNFINFILVKVAEFPNTTTNLLVCLRFPLFIIVYPSQS